MALPTSIPQHLRNRGQSVIAYIANPESFEELQLAVGGMTASSSTEFTRPANTTLYAINDVVGPAVTAVLTFSNIARVNGGSGYITRVRLMTDQITNTARYRLHLFKTAPTAIADNDPFQLLWANRAARLGWLDLDAVETAGTGSTAANMQNLIDRLPFVADAASRNLIGVLMTRDAFTPASGQQYFIELAAEQN